VEYVLLSVFIRVEDYRSAIFNRGKLSYTSHVSCRIRFAIEFYVRLVDMRYVNLSVEVFVN
jgi:hypothetical protein